MVQRKKNAHVISIDNGVRAGDKTGVQVSQRSSTGKDTHWDFLDDIEAPMWVDLTQECQFSYCCRDDEWFNISHPFHHCSSKELISAFTSSAEGCVNLNLFVQEQYSPKLPCSVSRSRGKDYRSRKWGQALDLRYPVKNLNDSPLSVNSVTTRVSVNQKGSGKRLGVGVSESFSSEKSSLTEIDAKHGHSGILLGDQKLLLNSTSFSGSESSITSDISQLLLHKSLELSNQVPVQTNRFLSALKISLRKSCVTRQASRMLVADRTQSEGQNSSSSNSSVGSSSAHGCDGKDMTVRDNKDMAPGSRYIPGLNMASSDKVEITKTSSATNQMRTGSSALSSSNKVSITKGSSTTKVKTGSSTLPSSKQHNTQGKQHTAHGKVFLPHSVKQGSSTATTIKGKQKAAATAGRQISAAAKENVLREIQSNTGMKVTRDIVQVQKVTGRKLPENCGKTKLKEKLSHKGEGKSVTMAQKACYFR